MDDRIYNGMRALDLGSEGWHKPWSGGNGGSCVEAMKLADGRVALRQSTDPDEYGTHLHGPRDQDVHRGCQGREGRLPAVLSRRIDNFE